MRASIFNRHYREKLFAVGVLLAGLMLAGLSTNAAAESHTALQVRSLGEEFPGRSYILTLPQQQVLDANSVQVRENGTLIQGVKVVPAAQAGEHKFGTMLVIDTSGSMGGRIEETMAAAREFAAQRDANQALGIVFFNGEAKLALAPTTDPERINEVLAGVPDLGPGTHIYDATLTAIEVLKREGIQAGSVVVLSDGADEGSKATLARVRDAGQAGHTRLFTVGIQSDSFKSETLSELASAGNGSYVLATSTGQLKSIFGSLAEAIGNEYLVSYRSQSTPGSRVDVAVSVSGITGVAQSSYSVAGASDTDGGFLSGWVMTIVVGLLVAMLLGIGIFLVSRSLRPDVRSRVGEFVSPRELISSGIAPLLRDTSKPPKLDDMSRRLSKNKWWNSFTLAVDIARVPIAPERIVLGTAAITIVMSLLFAIAFGQPVLAALALGIPIGVGLWIHYLAYKQRKLFADQLLDNLQVIASAMRAGHSFVGAMAAVVTDSPQPSKREFERVIQDEQLGASVEEALGEVGTRMRNDEVEQVGLIAVLQRETGGNTAEVLDRVSETVRERGKLRRLVQSLTAQGRLGGIVVSALPIALVAAISVLNPHFLDPMITQTAGKIVVGVAILLIVLGWVAIYKIINIKV